MSLFEDRKIEQIEREIERIEDMIFAMEIESDAAKALQCTLEERIASTKTWHTLVTKDDYLDFQQHFNEPFKHLNLLEERMLLVEKWIREHEESRILGASTDATSSSYEEA